MARISGTAYACGITSSGSGFVVADGRVVTNAHVVAGVDTPLVELPGRPAREGRVVYIDPVDDIAVISVDQLDAASLPIAQTLAVGSPRRRAGVPGWRPLHLGERADPVGGHGSGARHLRRFLRPA